MSSKRAREHKHLVEREKIMKHMLRNKNNKYDGLVNFYYAMGGVLPSYPRRRAIIKASTFSDRVAFAREKLGVSGVVSDILEVLTKGVIQEAAKTAPSIGRSKDEINASIGILEGLDEH